MCCDIDLRVSLYWIFYGKFIIFYFKKDIEYMLSTTLSLSPWFNWLQIKKKNNNLMQNCLEWVYRFHGQRIIPFKSWFYKCGWKGVLLWSFSLFRVLRSRMSTFSWSHRPYNSTWCYCQTSSEALPRCL